MMSWTFDDDEITFDNAVATFDGFAGGDIDPPVLTTITVSPAMATVTVGNTRQFTAATLDQYGDAIDAGDVEWSVSGDGSIDQGGLYTAAETAGGDVVTAMLNGVTGTATVTVSVPGTGDLSDETIAKIAAAVLAAAAVSPIHADVRAVDEAAGVAKEESVLAVLGAVEAIGGHGGGDRLVPIIATLNGAGVGGVRVSVVGTNIAARTDAFGHASLYLDGGSPAVDYTLRIAPPAGYLPVDDQEISVGNIDLDEIIVELVSTIPTPIDPGQASLAVRCVDVQGSPEAGVVVHGRVHASAKGSVGTAYDGETQEATSGIDGVAVLTVPRLVRYQVRRGGSKNWTTVDVRDVVLVEAPSFVGMP